MLQKSYKILFYCKLVSNIIRACKVLSRSYGKKLLQRTNKSLSLAINFAIVGCQLDKNLGFNANMTNKR